MEIEILDFFMNVPIPGGEKILLDKLLMIRGKDGRNQRRLSWLL
jgi:hypothetical protein